MAMLKSLLSSRVRAKLLTAFFLSPGTDHNAWELSRSIGENYSAVWKELSRLESLGILAGESKSNSKIYRVNLDCPITPELRSIVLKTEGLGDLIRKRLSEIGTIREAFLYGSYASGEADQRSDLDIMIIGDVDLPKFAALISELEEKIRRPINYVIFSQEEWKTRVQQEEPFVLNVLESPRIQLIGASHAV